jgi:hypothetical protein
MGPRGHRIVRFSRTRGKLRQNLFGRSLGHVPVPRKVFSDIHTIGIGAAKVAATFLCAVLAVLAANPLQSTCLPDGGKHYQANTDRSRYG